MLKFESTLVPAEPVVRVIIELPQERAEALAKAIDLGIVWGHTDVAEELEALHDALYSPKASA